MRSVVAFESEIGDIRDGMIKGEINGKIGGESERRG